MKKIEKISKRWQKIFLTKKEHLPVMCREIIEYLRPQDKKWIVDCTLGLGGHAQKILKNMSPDAKLIGIDKDRESLVLARERLKEFEDNILISLDLHKIDGAIFDLGSSMYQLSSFERGFSFLREGPLDMRMDRNSFISAYDLINHLSERELDYIFKEYGQERQHRRIAHCIVEERKHYPIATTMRLAGIIARVLGSRELRIHPATRVFQALRIVVNQEFESLKVGLDKTMSYLSKGARICVISFHSIEDRTVKETFRQHQATGRFKILASRPLRPSIWEVKSNPRARSARLRVIERI
jgi:16S rRNA (cytosine1402-N4)-methyltransferase